MPTTQDRVKLINARIVDVENGCYYPQLVSLVIQDGKIAAMPGLPGEPDHVPADAVIDLHGMTVIPGLFNTHCHLQFLPKGEVGSRQIAKNLSDCLDRGVTNVRDTLCYDLEENRAWIDKIKARRYPGSTYPPGRSCQPGGRHLCAPAQPNDPFFLFDDRDPR